MHQSLKKVLIVALLTTALSPTQQTFKVKIGNSILELSVITTEADRHQVLAKLGNLTEGRGTLVCYDHDRYIHFFGSKVDLDVIFLGSDWTIVDTKQVKKFTGNDIRDEEGVTSSKEARYALLIKSGQTDKLGAKIGDKITQTDQLKSLRIQEMPSISIKSKKIHVEIAYTNRSRSRGLMHRTNLSENDGMLFLYAEPEKLTLSTKNTPIDVSTAYIKPDGTLCDIIDMKAQTNDSHASSHPVQIALMMNNGWFKKNGIKVGDKAAIPEVIQGLADIKYLTAKISEKSFDLYVIAKELDRRQIFEKTDQIPEGCGYLICYAHDRYLHYFGPKVDMDVLFLDKSSKIVDVKELKRRTAWYITDEAGITSAKEARYALLVTAGAAKKLGIKIGDDLQFPDEFSEIRIQEMPLLTVKGKKAFVEVVYTAEARNRGLMHRTKMSKDNGMIFLFSGWQKIGFYMKNTLIPLSIAYIKPDGTILDILDMKPKDETPRPPRDYFQFALEMNQGWFKENDIKPGDKIEIPDDLRKLPAEG